MSRTYKICENCKNEQINDLIIHINKAINNFKSFNELNGIDLEITIASLKNCLETYEGFLKQAIEEEGK